MLIDTGSRADNIHLKKLQKKIKNIRLKLSRVVKYCQNNLNKILDECVSCENINL